MSFRREVQHSWLWEFAAWGKWILRVKEGFPLTIFRIFWPCTHIFLVEIKFTGSFIHKQYRQILILLHCFFEKARVYLHIHMYAQNSSIISRILLSAKMSSCAISLYCQGYFLSVPILWSNKETDVAKKKVKLLMFQSSCKKYLIFKTALWTWIYFPSIRNFRSAVSGLSNSFFSDSETVKKSSCSEGNEHIINTGSSGNILETWKTSKI